MSEGELKKNEEIVKAWGELQRQIFRYAGRLNIEARAEAGAEMLKLPKIHDASKNILRILKVLDEAKTELTSRENRTHFSWLSDERPIATTKYICIDYEIFKKWFGEAPP